MIHLKTALPRMASRILAAAVGVLIFFSCRNQPAKDETEDIQGNPASAIAESLGAPLPSLPYVAIFDETSEQLEAEQNPDFDPAQLTTDALTQALRTNYPEIGLEVDRISNDTVFVRITDARYLTQQMGSSGAQVYLMEATYAYTELPAIHVVHFEFEEGDHALPGSYTRESVSSGHPSR